MKVNDRIRIYMDNFRGFQDSFVDLHDVNFLVGENSTGKTSFLNLKHIFLSEKFWMDANFNWHEYGFGNYDEIVSIESSNKDYFSIGFGSDMVIADNNDKNSSSIVSCCFFTYKNVGGLPKIKKATLVLRNYVMSLVFTPKSTKLKLSELSPKKENDVSFDDFFKYVLGLHKDGSAKGYKLVPSDIGERKFPIIVFANIIFTKGFRDLDDSENFLLPILPPTGHWSLTWIAPIRTKPKRTYDEVRLDFSPEGEHVPYLVKKILDNDKSSKEFIRFVKRFGSDSGLFKDIRVHKLGRSQSSPFELDILLDNRPLNISNVGYGVSQALPLVVELFVRPEATWYAIQQPEVHLHPKAQAAFGELIFQLSTKEKKRFLVETHSDFTIDRFKILCGKNKNNLNAQILFFDRKNGVNRVSQITINKKGKVEGRMPINYRKFFLKEELKLLGIN